MESKVKEYQELYTGLEDILGQIDEYKKPIEQLEAEAEELKKKQQQYNYTDKDIVIWHMEKYIENAVENKNTELQNEIQEQLNTLRDVHEKSCKNIEKAMKWLSPKQIDRLMTQKIPNLEQEINVGQSGNDSEFIIASVFNKALAFIFRFDFLGFFPKVLRILTALIFWGIVLVPKIIAHVYNGFETKYKDYLLGLDDSEYEQAAEIIRKELIHASMNRILLVASVIVLINIVAYFLVRYFAQKYLLKNQLLYMAMYDPEKYRKTVYDRKIADFMNSAVKHWKEEIEDIRNNGLYEEKQKKSDACLIKPVIIDGLKEKYDKLAIEISQRKEEIDKYTANINMASKDVERLVAELNSKENGVLGMISDGGYNNGVLSPYVAFGFANEENHGVKKLISIRHNYKPVLICFNENSANNGEKFRKDCAFLIEKLMTGFFAESSMDIINMWLVDFEGLHFPDSRTRGMMKVLRTQQELQNLLSELRDVRGMVDSQGDGEIATINPDKLRKRENPVRYNIVFWVGVDFSSWNKEIVQLFISGENFGFLPILFMQKNTAQDLANEDDSAQAFAKVIKKVKESRQVYGYEGILREFECDLIVTNQKKELEGKLCADRMMSFKEFVEAASAGMNVADGESMYIDTYGLSEKLYAYLSEYDFTKFFTINDDIPDFVTEEVVKL